MRKVLWIACRIIVLVELIQVSNSFLSSWRRENWGQTPPPKSLKLIDNNGRLGEEQSIRPLKRISSLSSPLSSDNDSFITTTTTSSSALSLSSDPSMFFASVMNEKKDNGSNDNDETKEEPTKSIEEPQKEIETPKLEKNPIVEKIIEDVILPALDRDFERNVDPNILKGAAIAGAIVPLVVGGTKAVSWVLGSSLVAVYGCLLPRSKTGQICRTVGRLTWGAQEFATDSITKFKKGHPELFSPSSSAAAASSSALDIQVQEILDQANEALEEVKSLEDKRQQKIQQQEKKKDEEEEEVEWEWEGDGDDNEDWDGEWEWEEVQQAETKQPATGEEKGEDWEWVEVDQEEEEQEEEEVIELDQETSKGSDGVQYISSDSFSLDDQAQKEEEERLAREAMEAEAQAQQAAKEAREAEESLAREEAKLAEEEAKLLAQEQQILEEQGPFAAARFAESNRKEKVEDTNEISDQDYQDSIALAKRLNPEIYDNIATQEEQQGWERASRLADDLADEIHEGDVDDDEYYEEEADIEQGEDEMATLDSPESLMAAEAAIREIEEDQARKEDDIKRLRQQWEEEMYTGEVDVSLEAEEEMSSVKDDDDDDFDFDDVELQEMAAAARAAVNQAGAPTGEAFADMSTVSTAVDPTAALEEVSFEDLEAQMDAKIEARNRALQEQEEDEDEEFDFGDVEDIGAAARAAVDAAAQEAEGGEQQDVPDEFADIEAESLAFDDATAESKVLDIVDPMEDIGEAARAAMDSTEDDDYEYEYVYEEEEEVQPVTKEAVIVKDEDDEFPTMNYWASMKVADLKLELRKRGLSTTGKKADLVASLVESDLEREAAAAVSSGSNDEPTAEELAEVERDLYQINESVMEEEEEEIEETPPPEDESFYAAMTVAQLKDELRKRSLKVSGKKAELVERLMSA